MANEYTTGDIAAMFTEQAAQFIRIKLPKEQQEEARETLAMLQQVFQGSTESGIRELGAIFAEWQALRTKYNSLRETLSNTLGQYKHHH